MLETEKINNVMNLSHNTILMWFYFRGVRLGEPFEKGNDGHCLVVGYK